ncbi:MAG: 50S ribosomal protein L1 [Chthonomonas sp.]|nr:50S ribosomal protein L1 [Chthonomonas sp.]
MPKVKRKNPTSQRYAALAKQVDKDQFLDPAAAVTLVKATANTKFVESVDISIKLGIDTKKGDQNVRGTTSLPHGIGKIKRVAVLAKGDAAKEAEEAGADTVGAEELITKIANGFKDFDVLLAHEEMAPQIGKISKALGPKTPNKRNGTVTSTVAAAVREIKGATRVEYRADKGGVIHVPIGKVNFDDAKLIENFHAALGAVIKAKPSSAKGKYIQSVTLSSTMGPGVPIDVAVASKASGG